MRALVFLLLLSSASGAVMAEPAVAAPGSAPASAHEAEAPPLALRAFAGAAAGLAGGAAVLLSLPLAVPMIYLAALVSVPAVIGALPLLLFVPLFAAAGSGLAAAAFMEGPGPWLVAALTGASAGLVTLVVGAVVVPQRPQSALDLHLGVLSVVFVPSLAAALVAAAVTPFLVSGEGAAGIE